MTFFDIYEDKTKEQLEKLKKYYLTNIISYEKEYHKLLMNDVNNEKIKQKIKILTIILHTFNEKIALIDHLLARKRKT